MNHKDPKKPTSIENRDNPGLDADHSSDTPYQQLNSDNERISPQPDEKHNVDDLPGPLGDSPLEEK